MSLRNMHVDANVSDAELLARSDGLLKGFVAAFRQAAANGSFKFGGIELKDPDLNRVHSIVNEIDSRRVFYACGEDEHPKHAMTSLYKARDEIRVLSRGVWADPSCERLVQAISNSLAEYCTKAEKLKPDELSTRSPYSTNFMEVMTEMRLSVWVLVAVLQKKLGAVINPSHLPLLIKERIADAEV
jgi:hypothetical protein